MVPILWYQWTCEGVQGTPSTEFTCCADKVYFCIYLLLHSQCLSMAPTSPCGHSPDALFQTCGDSEKCCLSLTRLSSSRVITKDFFLTLAFSKIFILDSLSLLCRLCVILLFIRTRMIVQKAGICKFVFNVHLLSTGVLDSGLCL
jgi:hypothetical protein